MSPTEFYMTSDAFLARQNLWKYALVAAVGFLLVKFVESYRFSSKYKLPNPVAGRLPVVGNALQIPQDHKERLKYLGKLAEKYGDMYTLRIGRQDWIFVNSQRVVYDLLDKRASNFSNRLPTPMSHIATGGKRLLMMPYNDLWRRERKIMHQILNGSQRQSQLFAQFQDIESKALLHNYLLTPEKWYLAHGAFSGSVIMSVVFGRRARPEDENLQAAMQATEDYLAMLIPGKSVADVFPALAEIPYLKCLQPWRWHADELYERSSKIYKKEVDGLRDRMRLGVHKPCFMSEFFGSKEYRGFTEEEVLFLAATLLEAGTDTTRMSLNQVVAAATLFPDWTGRAREDLDAVCGSNAERLPTFDDIDQLPYIKAVVKESFRWKPSIADIGSPHATSADCEYEGYKIPAGTIVTTNHWLISNNPNEYDQPARFMPERFLNENLDKRLHGHQGFGAGRRVCVGYNVGTTNMHIAVARLLYCFDFLPDGDIDMSKPLSMDAEHASFNMKVQVRSEAHRMLIEKECSEEAIVR